MRMKKRLIMVEHIIAPFEELKKNLHSLQGGYASDTGNWVIKLEDGTIKCYVPDEDMRKANERCRYIK